MDIDPYADPEQLAIQQALARAAALRRQPAPARGQMVGDIYVKAPALAGAVPILNGLVADSVEQKAIGQQQQLTARQQEALGQWLKSRPQAKTTYGASDVGPTMEVTEPTDQDTADWAAQGLKNPLARTLAGDVMKDTIVQAPIRAEKARDKKELTLITNQRYDEDRKARAQLAAQNSASRLDLLRERLDRTDANTAAGLALRREIATEQNALRKYQIDAGIEQKEADRELKGVLAQLKANTGTRGGKGALSATQLKEIAGYQDAVSRQEGLGAEFTDDMSGPRAYAAAEIGGTFINKDPKMAKIAQWWRDFRANDNVERHELFGASLTEGEKRSWAQTTVTPLSSPEQIRDAIRTRQELAEKAIARRLELYTNGPKLPGAAPAAAPPAPTTNFPRTRVTPAEQASRNGEQADVLLNEIRTGTNVANQADYDGLVRELKRTGYKGAIPPMKIAAPGAAAESAPPKTVKWSDLK